MLPVHPAADLFPMLSKDELKALGEDIRKHGLQNKVVLWTGGPDGPMLLDGRNRLDAMEQVLWAPIVEGGKLSDRICRLWKGGDPYAYVISANIHRRHLNVEQRQALLIELIARAPQKSDRQIGKAIGVDGKTVGVARAKGEDVGRIPHVETRTDTKGREQPAKKPRRTEDDFKRDVDRTAELRAAAQDAEAKGMPELAQRYLAEIPGNKRALQEKLEAIDRESRRVADATNVKTVQEPPKTITLAVKQPAHDIGHRLRSLFDSLGWLLEIAKANPEEFGDISAFGERLMMKASEFIELAQRRKGAS